MGRKGPSGPLGTCGGVKKWIVHPYYSGRQRLSLEFPPVDLQLTALVGELRSAERHLHALRTTLPRDAWHRRPGPARWSPAECVAHLNLASEAMLPLVRVGLQAASKGFRREGFQYRRDLVGWMVWKVISPTVTLRTRTIPAFVPTADCSPEDLIADFVRLQAELMSCVRAADGLPIDQVKLQSPFDRRLKYNLFAALTIVARHQHRHLLQAERAAGAVGLDASAFAVPARTATP